MMLGKKTISYFRWFLREQRSKIGWTYLKNQTADAKFTKKIKHTVLKQMELDLPWIMTGNYQFLKFSVISEPPASQNWTDVAQIQHAYYD